MKPTLAFTLILTAACVAEPEIPNGKAKFAQDCASCHGVDAKGAGPVAQSLGVLAPDLTQLAARNAGVFPRETVMAIIDGLNRDPHFSDAMPEFGAGDLGEAVIVETAPGIGTPTPIGLIALADYLESIQTP